MQSLLIRTEMIICAKPPQAHVILYTQAGEEVDVVQRSFFHDVFEETGDIANPGFFFINHGHKIVHVRDKVEDRCLFQHFLRDLILVQSRFNQGTLDLVPAGEFRKELAEILVYLFASLILSVKSVVAGLIHSPL